MLGMCNKPHNFHNHDNDTKATLRKSINIMFDRNYYVPNLVTRNHDFENYIVIQLN
jgi:hypothetical protein